MGMPMPMPCHAVPRPQAPCHMPRVPAVVVEPGELDSGDDPWHGFRVGIDGSLSAHLGCLVGLFHQADIGIDLDDLMSCSCPALPCSSLPYSTLHILRYSRPRLHIRTDKAGACDASGRPPRSRTRSAPEERRARAVPCATVPYSM